MKVIIAAIVVALGLALQPVASEAAINYFDQTKVVSGWRTGNVPLLCPTGYKVTGGGAEVATRGYAITKSVPYSTNGWQARSSRPDSGATVYAICVR